MARIVSLFVCFSCLLWIGISTIEACVDPDSHTVNHMTTTGSDCLLTHTLEGTLDTADIWYGFIANISFHTSESIKFLFSSPYDMQVQNILLYSEREVGLLNEGQSCWQKYGVIPSADIMDRVIDLSYRSSWNGCIAEDTPEGRLLVCESEKVFNVPGEIYMAVCNCRASNRLYLYYRLEIDEVVC